MNRFVRTILAHLMVCVNFDDDDDGGGEGARHDWDGKLRGVHCRRLKLAPIR